MRSPHQPRACLHTRVIAILGVWAVVIALGGCVEDASPSDTGLTDGYTAPNNANPAVVSPDDATVRALLGLPERFPLPYIPEDNPLTAEKIALGRQLFYDVRLSTAQTHACASCHRREDAFARRFEPAIAPDDTLHTRNTPSLANVAYLGTLTWADTRLHTLETLLGAGSPHSMHGVSGASDAARAESLARIDADADYARMFAAAFPGEEARATHAKVAAALASFCRTLVSGSSPFDRYVMGDRDALTPQQRRGFVLFNSERFECFHCHNGLLLSASYRDANTPASDLDDPVHPPLSNVGLYNIDGTGSYPPRDQGLYHATADPSDRGVFRAPSLRNVALTAPYMHDGSLSTLRDVVQHYVDGGRVTERGAWAGDGRASPLKSEYVRPFGATPSEVDDVVAFLEALTDDAFVADPKHADPFLEGSGAAP